MSYHNHNLLVVEPLYCNLFTAAIFDTKFVKSRGWVLREAQALWRKMGQAMGTGKNTANPVVAGRSQLSTLTVLSSRNNVQIVAVGGLGPRLHQAGLIL